MRTEENESQPFPVLFLVFAVVATCWWFWPRAGEVQHGGITVRAELFAPNKSPKQGLIPVYMLEDAIKERLRTRPATFKKGR
jgi:hypothetical protein